MLPRLQSGQPASTALSARVLNEAFRSIEQKSAAAAVAASTPVVLVRVVNESGAVIQANCPVGIGDCKNAQTDGVTGKTLHELLFASIEPVEGTLWGIAQDAIPVDGTGLVLIAGPAWLAVQSLATETHASPAGHYDFCVGSGSGAFWVLDSSSGSVGSTTRLIAGVMLPSGGGTTAPFLSYYKLQAPGGPTALSFNWSLIEIDTATTVASGSWTLGDTFAAMKAAIDSATGEDVLFYSAGPFPLNEVTIHPNRPFGVEKYEFAVTSHSITQATGAWGFLQKSICFMPGG